MKSKIKKAFTKNTKLSQDSSVYLKPPLTSFIGTYNGGPGDHKPPTILIILLIVIVVTLIIL